MNWKFAQQSLGAVRQEGQSKEQVQEEGQKNASAETTDQPGQAAEAEQATWPCLARW